MQLGIYEQLINQLIQSRISELDKHSFYIGEKILNPEEASTYLSRYIAEVIHYSLNSLKKDESVKIGIDLVNDIIRLIRDKLNLEDIEGNLLEAKGRFLTAVIDETSCSYPDIAEYLTAITPYTRLTQSELFTGANQTISLESELKREIASSDEICFLVSFIKWSGIRVFEKELREFSDNGKKLRIIATSYMGATDLKAIQFLASLKNAEVKISYNTGNERLHAKAYLFLRNSGFDTGYIGSSNLSYAALTNGLEWNLKITTSEIGHVIDKFHKTFETYWENTEFETFRLGIDDTRLKNSLQSQHTGKELDCAAFFDLSPYPFQKEILDELMIEREVHNHWRNLVVAATGTGKTMVAAFDYRQFKNNNSKARLLFIAHRKEILQQAQARFRGVMRDNNFGELWVDGLEPDNYEFVFASVATLKNRLPELTLSRDFYDYIIIDEVHHVAANSYRPILERFSPKVLLGLTATPERMDGADISVDFCNTIAAEIRLPEALNRKLLCPFQYFGITDDVDLSHVAWNSGKYDIVELTKLYTSNDQRVSQILKSLDQYLTDINNVQALCFCASIEHADFMAKKFTLAGLKAATLTGTNNRTERTEVRKKLENKEINYLFVVDVFNEGIDIPSIDTVLFLRPTESLTIFLQQLGRGLRLNERKECLTVLDFVGNARAEYDFESRFRALIGRTNTSVKEEIEKGFVHLPLGCSIVLERVAQRHILDNIKSFTTFNRTRIIQRIRNYRNESNLPLTLTNFLKITHIPLRKIYSWEGVSWTSLCMEANVIEQQDIPFTKEFVRAVRKKWLSTDAYSYFDFILQLSKKHFRLKEADLSETEKLMAIMFYYDIWQNAGIFPSLEQMFNTLSKSPLLIAELKELMTLLCNETEALEIPLKIDFTCPLKVHARYTREQIQVALGLSSLEKKSSGREGVERNKQLNVEAMFVDLNKTGKDYSPTTLYNDYALSDTLFHWQSQNSAHEDTPVGQAYIHQTQRMLLFVREQKKDECNHTMGYIFLGEVKYVSHYGRCPMNIRWLLNTPMPASLWSFAGKLSVG